MVELTLLRQHNPLASSAEQVRVLDATDHVPEFGATLADHGLPPLAARGIEVLQVNVGKLCNQTCHHCHVDAGPDRRESMSRETADACLRVLADAHIPTLDITGGAPEMNPNFRRLVQQARRLGRHVIDRSNLTILLAPGHEDLPEFLARHQVEVVASLPCYLEENCDRQRGQGVFQRSIEALRRLNALGYGRPNMTGDCPDFSESASKNETVPLAPDPLPLTLVFNPVGPSLPPPQAQLEADYRRELATRYGVQFTRLYTITNMPISRFLDDLLHSGQYDQYMEKLVTAFNPRAADGVMCRTILSVDWQGRLYDCDFNQMLELPVEPTAPQTIHDFNWDRLASRRITTGRHCYGCTAAAGSGCTGAIQR